MPYFIYKITPAPKPILKTLELLDRFETFKDAKNAAREMRKNKPAEDNYEFKVIFAGTELEAEETLMEVREKTVVREWEK